MPDLTMSRGDACEILDREGRHAFRGAMRGKWPSSDAWNDPGIVDEVMALIAADFPQPEASMESLVEKATPATNKVLVAYNDRPCAIVVFKSGDMLVPIMFDLPRMSLGYVAYWDLVENMFQEDRPRLRAEIGDDRRYIKETFKSGMALDLSGGLSLEEKVMGRDGVAWNLLDLHSFLLGVRTVYFDLDPETLTGKLLSPYFDALTESLDVMRNLQKVLLNNPRTGAFSKAAPTVWERSAPKPLQRAHRIPPGPIREEDLEPDERAAFRKLKYLVSRDRIRKSN